MRIFFPLLLIALIQLHPSSLNAQLSPGALAEPHAHLSGITNCLNCHTWGSKDLSPKCLDCHTPIQNRIRSGSGFHGQLEDTDCLTCHSDHMDRDFEMIHWDPSKEDFDHFVTGYEIEGKHLDLECSDCHQKTFIKSEDVLDYAFSKKTADVLASTFLGLGTSCVDCHVDVHFKEFEDRSCQDCHTEDSWNDARDDYDHDIDTNFPLRGAHQELMCEKCHSESQAPINDHLVQKFTGLKYDLCTECHQDEHSGSFGSNCLKCHTESTFKQVDLTGSFDHQTTRYPLVGKHVTVNCNSCHLHEDRFKLTTSFDQCEDCHSDPHDGIFDKPDRQVTCDQCHNVRGFFPPLFGVLEHRETRFILDGAHLAQPCIFCHFPDDEPMYRWQPLACTSCHDTIHGDQFRDYQQNENWCENCHKTSEWTDLGFDHASTDFPLTGKHRNISCSACHQDNGMEVVYENTDTNCAACHRDVHASQFQTQMCSHCHSTSDWHINEFDHLALTKFPLDGQHEILTCGECHKYEESLGTIRFKPVPHKCQDCHSFGDLK